MLLRSHTLVEGKQNFWCRLCMFDNSRWTNIFPHTAICSWWTRCLGLQRVMERSQKGWLPLRIPSDTPGVSHAGPSWFECHLSALVNHQARTVPSLIQETELEGFCLLICFHIYRNILSLTNKQTVHRLRLGQVCNLVVFPSYEAPNQMASGKVKVTTIATKARKMCKPFTEVKETPNITTTCKNHIKEIKSELNIISIYIYTT